MVIDEKYLDVDRNRKLVHEGRCVVCEKDCPPDKESDNILGVCRECEADPKNAELMNEWYA